MGVAKRYLDFDLHIWREGDQYKAEVRGSPVGPSAKVLLNWPFGTEPSENLLLRLENAVLKGRGYRAGGPPTTEEKILREFGTDVFRAVFRNSDAVASKFSSSLDKLREKDAGAAGLRLKMHIEPPELAVLPWEYMFDASSGRDDDVQNDFSFLCLRNNSPLVRFLDVEGREPLGIERPLRILGMIANPGGDWERLDTDQERHRIEAALRALPKGAVQFEWVQGGTPDDLFDQMQSGSWHIFHFVGHGGVDRYIDDAGVQRSEGYVVMQDGLGGAAKVSASHLGLMLDGDGSLRLAVLNCCDSAAGALSSAGAALVRSGVPMAVAMQFGITNGSASRFAGAFYKSLANGEQVERALTAARVFVRGASNVEWAIPVLFTRTGSSVLLEVPAATAAVQTPAAAALPATGGERNAASGPAWLTASDQAEVRAPASTAERNERRAQAQERLRRLFA